MAGGGQRGSLDSGVHTNWSTMTSVVVTGSGGDVGQRGSSDPGWQTY